MANNEQISLLRRKRAALLCRLKFTSKRLYEYQKLSQQKKDILTLYHKTIDKLWSKFNVVQEELELLNEENSILDFYHAQDTHLTELSGRAQPSKPETSISVRSSATLWPIAIELSKIRLPIFDGTIENWNAFYKIFSLIIDRNDQLMPVQKLHFLQASVTGEAASYVQSLNSTKISYAGVIVALKNRYDCPREICLRHFFAMQNYPRLTSETPATLANLIGAMKLHLHALKNLGDSITSNTNIIGLFLSKLNPDTIQQWEFSIPNKRMPPYTHLLDFLEKKANCDLTTSVDTPARQTPEQHKALRQGCPQRNAFTTTHFPLACPICQASHEIWTCDIFKAKPVKERLTAVKELSMCTNCLKEGHSILSCSSESCRICGLRHHTLLHWDEIEVNNRQSITG
ncbi:uncharacterized protein LOC132915547 [Bombus pascuorum]|uniref:uncharacterized protein LOC132915547 n=1 Tax=Bombus pascuorum TaxID=65598 RepID=UPI00298E49AC|nr:uncharacterized protein LOC132915547 [Bombus pascuorum]